MRRDDAALRVGFRWAGSSTFIAEHHRSTDFERWRPVLETAGVRWFSLQTEDRAAVMDAVGKEIALSPELIDQEVVEQTEPESERLVAGERAVWGEIDFRGWQRDMIPRLIKGRLETARAAERRAG